MSALIPDLLQTAPTGARGASAPPATGQGHTWLREMERAQLSGWFRGVGGGQGGAAVAVSRSPLAQAAAAPSPVERAPEAHSSAAGAGQAQDPNAANPAPESARLAATTGAQPAPGHASGQQGLATQRRSAQPTLLQPQSVVMNSHAASPTDKQAGPQSTVRAEPVEASARQQSANPSTSSGRTEGCALATPSTRDEPTASALPANAIVRAALANANTQAVAEPLRIHVEQSPDGLAVWLGIDGDPAHAQARAAAIVQALRRTAYA
ncbi:MAG TPA: hypothetical protein VLJ86_25080, partial [Ramlibacter sp.]|nr:hypothetical protein [Ramlibacter sp.]